MKRFNNALQELRAERSRAQLEVEKLDQAISVIKSLEGSELPSKAKPIRVVSAASRRKMAEAQQKRWANIRNGSKPFSSQAQAATSGKRRTLSAAARKKIATAQRARWAKVRAAKKAA